MRGPQLVRIPHMAVLQPPGCSHHGSHPEAEEGWELLVLASLTLEMERGMLKSFPPCSLKPQGAGPFSITL